MRETGCGLSQRGTCSPVIVIDAAPDHGYSDPQEEDLSKGRGYGLNAMNREATDGGYYIQTLELPPSPEGTIPFYPHDRLGLELHLTYSFVSLGALVPGQALETRRVRLVPFQWQRRRRPSNQQASR